MTTMRAFTRRAKITAEIVRDRGMQIEDGWEHHAYELRLHRYTRDGDPRTLDTPWKQGTGINTSPVDTPEAILDSLISDALCYEDARSFEEWADERGYDTDSRKAEDLYRRCGDVLKALEEFIRPDYSKTTLRNLERL